MRTLAIETAAEACSVALFEDGALVAHAHALVGRGHAERLVPMIAGLPQHGRAERILVDCGPGSFTGVRVGLAAARAFGLGWRAQVQGYSSLALIAASVFARANVRGTLAVALIGGHGELFVQRFDGSPMRPIAPLASLSPDAAARLCGPDPVAGSGAAMAIEAGATGPAIPAVPDARDILLLPPECTSLPPSPIYGRAPDARLPA